MIEGDYIVCARNIRYSDEYPYLVTKGKKYKIEIESSILYQYLIVDDSGAKCYIHTQEKYDHWVNGGIKYNDYLWKENFVSTKRWREIQLDKLDI